jgi:hypothetical protein
MMSDRDYPTDAELDCITAWDYKDPVGWFDYIKGLWWMADGGVTEKPRRLYMSTGGWSGNEDIIQAMKGNFILWSQHCISTRAGGRFTFKKPRRKKCTTEKETQLK